MFFSSFGGGIFFVEIALFLCGIGLPIWALIDAAMRPDWAWQRAGENKGVYMALLVGSMVVGLFCCGLLSIGMSLVYFLGVRPKVRNVEKGGPGLASGYPGYPGYGPYGSPMYGPGSYPAAGYDEFGVPLGGAGVPAAAAGSTGRYGPVPGSTGGVRASRPAVHPRCTGPVRVSPSRRHLLLPVRGSSPRRPWPRHRGTDPPGRRAWRRHRPHRCGTSPRAPRGGRRRVKARRCPCRRSPSRRSRRTTCRPAPARSSSRRRRRPMRRRSSPRRPGPARSRHRRLPAPARPRPPPAGETGGPGWRPPDWEPSVTWTPPDVAPPVEPPSCRRRAGSRPGVPEPVVAEADAPTTALPDAIEPTQPIPPTETPDDPDHEVPGT